MLEKTSIQTSNVDIRLGSTVRFRNGDISDMARLLRKEEAIGKRLHSVLDINGTLEKAIKLHQSQVGDERASITYQLAELLKQMTYKFHHFADEKLQRWKFRNGEIAKHSLQLMMQRYEKVEEESQAMKHIMEGLQSINDSYQAHAREMEELLMSIETASQAHEQAMNAAIDQVAAESLRKQTEWQTAEQRTRQLAADIDSFISSARELRAAQREEAGKVERLRRIATSQQEKANAIAEWEKFAVDLGNRQMASRTLAEKHQCLQKAKIRNDMLEIFLHELQAEEAVFKAKAAAKVHAKENAQPTPKKKDSVKKQNQN